VLKAIRTLLLVLLVGTLSGCSASLSSQLVGKPAPQATLYMMDGTPVSIADLKGRQIVLMFWASWCSKSKQVLTRLNDYAGEFAGRRDIVFVTNAIDKQEELQKVQDIIRDQKLTNLRHAFSGNEYYDEAFNAFKVDEFPMIFLIDRNGSVTAFGESEKFLKELLH
jgi:thiol-disulfide isomerase/thioredoxin